MKHSFLKFEPRSIFFVLFLIVFAVALALFLLEVVENGKSLKDELAMVLLMISSVLGAVSMYLSILNVRKLEADKNN